MRYSFQLKSNTFFRFSLELEMVILVSDGWWHIINASGDSCCNPIGEDENINAIATKKLIISNVPRAREGRRRRRRRKLGQELVALDV